MALPPGPRIRPPAPPFYEGDLERGIKPDLKDLMAISLGVYKETLDTETAAASTVDIPITYHGLLVRGTCWNDTSGTYNVIELIRNGETHYIALPATNDWDAAAPEGSNNSVLMKTMRVRPGDIIRGQDLAAVGGGSNIYLTIGIVRLV